MRWQILNGRQGEAVIRLNNGKPVYFDGIDNSAYILGKAEESARTSWVYIDAVDFLGVRCGEWKSLFTAKDTWLGPKPASREWPLTSTMNWTVVPRA